MAVTWNGVFGWISGRVLPTLLLPHLLPRDESWLTADCPSQSHLKTVVFFHLALCWSCEAQVLIDCGLGLLSLVVGQGDK